MTWVQWFKYLCPVWIMFAGAIVTFFEYGEGGAFFGPLLMLLAMYDFILGKLLTENKPEEKEDDDS